MKEAMITANKMDFCEIMAILLLQFMRCDDDSFTALSSEAPKGPVVCREISVFPAVGTLQAREPPWRQARAHRDLRIP